jgi:hypothetical protein
LCLLFCCSGDNLPWICLRRWVPVLKPMMKESGRLEARSALAWGWRSCLASPFDDDGESRTLPEGRPGGVWIGGWQQCPGLSSGASSRAVKDCGGVAQGRQQHLALPFDDGEASCALPGETNWFFTNRNPTLYTSVVVPGGLPRAIPCLSNTKNPNREKTNKVQHLFITLIRVHLFSTCWVQVQQDWVK